MANYNVGNIEIGVITNSKTTISSIDNLIKKINQIDKLDKAIQDSFISINKLGNGLQKINKLNMANVISQFDKISNATKTLNDKLNSIQNPNFKETALALNKLGNAFRQFDKLKNFDFRNMYNSFNSINRIITPFLQKLKDSEQSLVAMSNVLNNLKAKTITKATNEINKLEKSTKIVSKESEKANSNFNKMFNLGKIYWFLNYTKQLTRGLANIVTTAINFEETLNKFQVSFGEFSNEATKFANQLTYSFNLSRQSLMDYMSTFNSMLKGLGGIEGQQAYQLSETLTQLALDYSSLFNVSVDRAMSSFQSVLSGQIRAIRSVSGVDVSENTIFQYYQELGGEKSMRQLSQLEKRLLRIYALEKQLDSLGAVGDLQKTINSSSNMIKQLQETMSEAFVSIGNIALKVIQPIIKGALSVALVIKDVSKSMADLMGATTTEYENDSANSLFGGIEEGAENAEEAVNSLLGKLSFDKFEALTSSQQSQTNDLTTILNAIAQYETKFAQINSDARNIADGILTWLGYTKEINEETGNVSWRLNEGYNNIEKIKDVVLVLVSLGVSSLIIKLTKNMGSFIVSLKSVETSVNALNLALGTILLSSVINVILMWDNLSKTARIVNVAIIGLSTTLLIVKNRMLIAQVVGKLSVAFSMLGFTTNGLTNILLKMGSSLLFIVGTIAIFSFMDSWNAKTKTLVGTLATLVSALTIATTAWLAYHSAMTLGSAIPIILGATALGVAGMTSMIKGINQYEDGGIPTRGQMFIANESGPELVGNIGSQTTVANNDMIVTAIENASYRGMEKAISQNQNQTNVTFNFKGVNGNDMAKVLFNPMIDEARRNGYEVKKA